MLFSFGLVLFLGLKQSNADTFAICSQYDWDTPFEAIDHLISSGRIRGKRVVTNEGNEGSAFLSIPYAEAPVGNLRFALPTRKADWEGVMDCTQYKNQCYSNSTDQCHPEVISTVSEDCLNINVITPPGTLSASGEHGPHPILFYIHGGYNDFDFPAMVSPEWWIDHYCKKGIIVVSLSYRLGALGFWSTGTSDARGNYALEDMIEGLKWVQREIGYFGGDKSMVTAAGYSSAGSCISLLSLSPKTAGLFQRVALYSGNAAATHDVETTLPDKYGITKLAQCYIALTRYKQLAHKLGCGKKSDWESEYGIRSIVDCMRQVPPGLLVNSYGNPLNQGEGQPNSDGSRARVDGEGGVLPDIPQILARSRRPYDMLTGNVADESGATEIMLSETTTEFMVGTTCQSTANALSTDTTTAAAIKNACVELYKPNVFGKNVNSYGILVGDLTFYYDDYSDALTMAEVGGNVYLYSFNFVDTHTDYHMHASDLTYVFGTHPHFPSEENEWMTNVYSNFLAEFVAYGNPTTFAVGNGTYWKQLPKLKNPSSANYFAINYHDLANKPYFHNQTMEFWSKTVPQLLRSNHPLNYVNFMQANAEAVKHAGNANGLLAAVIGTVLLVLIVVVVFGILYKRGMRSSTVRYTQLI